MKTTDLIWKAINTILLIVMLIIGIMILRKVNRCCNCNEKRETVFVAHTAEVYDSLTHKKGVSASIDKLSIGEKGDTIVITFNLETLWINCPENVAVKAPVIVKKSSTTQLTKKVTKSVPSVKEESVKKDSVSKLRQNLIESILREKSEVSDTLKVEVKKDTCLEISRVPDTLKVEVERVTPKSTSLLYSQMSVLPMYYGGVGNKLQFNYDVVPDLHLREYIERAKRHLWVGTTLASVGALAYTSTMFCEVPTFVEYNGLGLFDPVNKYYNHNINERERLRTLKWVRGASVAVGVLGGVEVIHGILLLKNADLSIAPERITLRYSF
jgi:hypothetical protein